MIGLLPVLLLHLTIAAPALSDPAPQVPLAVTGAWTGEVDVSVDSAKTPTPVCLLLFITPNGQVHGVIGDATLLNARIEPGRGVVGRMLRIGSEWQIAGDLKGQIVPSDDDPTPLPRVAIAIDREGDHLEAAILAVGPPIRGHREVLRSIGKARLERLP